jgi:tetratricopeptide (TPR) repeat protein
MPLSRFIRALAVFFAAVFAAAVASSKASPADKQEIWTEVQTPHFTVASNDGENTARRIADQFEQIRFLYSKALNRNIRLDPGIPILIFAVKNEKALSQLIPENWTQKGHTHPGGIFVPGREKNYIALRTDVEYEFPYLPIYHEYVHLIINLNYQHFPVWLNEGFADFLGCATLTAKGAKMGEPSSTDLQVLQQNKLLPLETLFRVDHQSPYYNEANKTSIFYAESWALIHYLMLDPEHQKNQAVCKYISLVESGADPVDAGTRAFGDLAQLQKSLQSYINRPSYMEYSVELPAKLEAKDYSVRTISAAEAQARLGDFDLYRGQLDAARKRLEEAIRLDPDLAAAQESMGLLLFRQNERYGAEKYFARAVALDSKSALAYFYHAMLLTSEGSDAEGIAEAKSALQKAVVLNPGLGSAWTNLALLYANTGTLDSALNAAKRAVDTMPGEPHYQYNLAFVLARMERFEEARAIARKLQISGDPDVVSLAGKLLAQVDQEQQYATYKKANESNAASAMSLRHETEMNTNVPAPALKQRTQNVANPTRLDNESASAIAVDGASAPAAPRAYSMVGIISDVSCTPTPQVRITLKAQSIVMRLHAGDFSQVAVKSAGANSAAMNVGCAALRGKSARVSYQLVSDKDWDGELVSIEFRNTP